MAGKSQEISEIRSFPEVANPRASLGSAEDDQQNTMAPPQMHPPFWPENPGTAEIGPEAFEFALPAEKPDSTARSEMAEGCSPETHCASLSQPSPLRSTSSAFVPDTVAGGVVMLLLLAGLQRLIGFVRAVWFCRHLSPEELGQWELLFSFLNLAAPMVILSLPGAFGRYAERYRQRGQLRSFLRQTALVCAACTAAAALALLGAKSWLDQLLFGGARSEDLLLVLPAALASIIALNYLTELFTALRNVRISSVCFFVNSLLFALLGVALLAWWRNDALAVTAAYGLANLLTAAAALLALRRNWALLPTESDRLPTLPLWRDLLPFAFSVWTINLATNLFSMVDRYLIVHFAPTTPEAALAMVGQYHSSRLLPLLLLSVLQMLGSMILPYMSADWEAGFVQRAGYRLRLALKLLALGMTALAALVLICSPLLFHSALAGKFQAGQQVLPGTLCYCIWFGLALVAQNYLWCAEKAYLATLALVLGLATNIGLNIWLLPRWGLQGVVIGTSLSHLAALGMMLLCACRLGFRPDKALLALLLLPASLLLGPAGAVSILALILLAVIRRGNFFAPQEKQLLRQGLVGKKGRWLWQALSENQPPTMESLP